MSLACATTIATSALTGHLLQRGDWPWPILTGALTAVYLYFWVTED